MGVGRDQAPVLVARVIAEASAPLALVALDPFVEEPQEPDFALLAQLATVAVGLVPALDPPRLLVGAGATLPLPAGDFDHGDVADHLPVRIDPPVDPGGLGLPQPPPVAGGWTIGARRPTL